MNLSDLKEKEENNNNIKAEGSNQVIESNKKEDALKVLINQILDSKPEIIKEFNNGDIRVMDTVVLDIKERLGLSISDDALTNLVGEEILSR